MVMPLGKEPGFHQILKAMENFPKYEQVLQISPRGLHGIGGDVLTAQTGQGSYPSPAS